MGRGEKFYKYNGFSREISLAFKVHVQSKYEQQTIYKKLNYLASLTAPNYGNSGMMRGNIIKLTVGDYLRETPGILKGFTFTIDENYPWDIGRDVLGNIDDNSRILPMIISVNSFQFTPIHSFLPRTDQDAKFISTPLQTNTRNSFQQAQVSSTPLITPVPTPRNDFYIPRMRR